MDRDTCIVTMATLTLVFAANLEATQNCSVQTIAGTYGAVYSGYSYGQDPAAPTPWVDLGTLTVEPDGQAHGAYTMMAGGMRMDATMINGQVIMRPDCSFNLTATSVFSGGGQVDGEQECVVADNGKEIRCTARCMGITMKGVLKRLDHWGTCPALQVRGAYSMTCSGWCAKEGCIGFPPFEAVGAVSYDQDGHYTGHGYMSLGGFPGVGTMEDGLLQLNPDCTASWTHTLASGLEWGKLLVLEQGKTLWSMSTTPGEIFTCEMKRMSPE